MEKIKGYLTCKQMSGVYLVATAALSIATLGVGLYAYTSKEVDTSTRTDVTIPQAKVSVDYIEKVRVVSTGETEENNRFMAGIPSIVSKNKKEMKSKMNPQQYEKLKRFALDAERSSVTSTTVDMNSAIVACALGLWGVSNVMCVTVEVCDPYNNTCDPKQPLPVPFDDKKPQDMAIKVDNDTKKDVVNAELFTFDDNNRSYLILVKSKGVGEHISCVLVDTSKQMMFVFGSSKKLPDIFF
jgi:hypothetical protein